MTECESCRGMIGEQALFCPHCGTKAAAQPSLEEQDLNEKIKRLRSELHSVEEASKIQSFGFYEPRFGLENSSEYLERLKVIRDDQKKMVRDNTATDCPKNWVVDGSLKKGRDMMAEQTQLMIRAFNGECDAAVTAVKYDNISRVEKRIKKSFDSINKLGASKSAALSRTYFETKLIELHLVHEHREKVEQEKEEHRELQREMKEQQRVEKELEKAQKDAEKDESKYGKALEKARDDLAESTGRQHEKLEALVNKLQSELSEAIDRKAKSIARAQLTRSGHVYILSNVGSFGDGVYKIGMTRRLEPLDRVYELGDASVPFRFDVHAMIYSDDAPALEHSLHQEFEAYRVNKINRRREYFRVTLEEIAEAVGRLHGVITYVIAPGAEEFRQTLAMNGNTPDDPVQSH